MKKYCYIAPSSREELFQGVTAEELVNDSYKRNLIVSRLDAECAKLDRYMLGYEHLNAAKKALLYTPIDSTFLNVFDRDGELSELVGLSMEICATESFTPEVRDLYIKKIDMAMEGWKENFNKTINAIITSFIEYWKDWVVNNRRYRFQLQKHEAALQNNISSYCAGEQNNFNNIKLAVYHNTVWREMLQAANTLTDTYGDITSSADAAEKYFKKNEEVVSKALKVFGQSLTATAVVNSGAPPERKTMSLGTAQWKLGDLQNFCGTTIEMLKTDQLQMNVMNHLIRQMRTAINQANKVREGGTVEQSPTATATGSIDDPKLSAEEMFNQVSRLRALVKKISTNCGGVARALLMICNAAASWTPQVDQY